MTVTNILRILMNGTVGTILILAIYIVMFIGLADLAGELTHANVGDVFIEAVFSIRDCVLAGWYWLVN